ncbi:MAG: DUF3617 family protein [Bryobacteraceae bacterium]|jgi:hypothetical protein
MMEKILFSVAAALLLPIGITNAADPPELKEGLWTSHRQTTHNPGNKVSEQTSTICRNHAYDQHMQSLARDVKGCTTVSESFQDGVYSLELHCVVSGTVIESKGTTTFQGDTAAHTETHATYTPALRDLSESTVITDQKYVGSCPAGAKPGDITYADGSVIHWVH